MVEEHDSCYVRDYKSVIFSILQEWPGARKYKNKHVPNIDLFEEMFGAITVTGAEGWSAQQEESSLDSRVSGNNDEEDDCTYMPPPVGDTQNKNGGSRSKRKRKEVDPSTENAARCNVILDEKNQLMGKMILLMERENLRSGERGVEILNDLPGVKKWSKFHLAAVDHLLADPANRQGFIAFSSAEDKITILENRMGIKLDD